MDIVGVDPGGRETGIILLSGKDLKRACVVRRDSDGKLPNAVDLAEVVATVIEYLADGDSPTIAMETLVAPTGYQTINVYGILGTAMVMGAILGKFPNCILVPPGLNGSGPMAMYPKLIQAKPGGKGADRMRHTRSAYDVAMRGKVVLAASHGPE